MAGVDAADAAGRRQEAMLSGLFASLLETLVDDFDVVDLMDRLAQTCCELFPDVTAGLLLRDQSGRPQVVATSSEEARLLELFALQSDEGPCVDCLATGTAVHVEDLAQQTERWPRFSEAALALGFRTVHALPLRARSEVVGGLNLFCSAPPGLTDHERQIAQALADVATIGLLQQRSLDRASALAEQLQTALDSRVVIEQAKGVVAHHGQLAMEQAFSALRSYARNGNLKLSHVARDVVAGHLPPDAITRATPA